MINRSIFLLTSLCPELVLQLVAEMAVDLGHLLPFTYQEKGVSQ